MSHVPRHRMFLMLCKTINIWLKTESSAPGARHPCARYAIHYRSAWDTFKIWPRAILCRTYWFSSPVSKNVSPVFLLMRFQELQGSLWIHRWDLLCHEVWVFWSKTGEWADFVNSAVLRVEEDHVPESCLQIENGHKNNSKRFYLE